MLMMSVILNAIFRVARLQFHQRKRGRGLISVFVWITSINAFSNIGFDLTFTAAIKLKRRFQVKQPCLLNRDSVRDYFRLYTREDGHPE